MFVIAATLAMNTRRAAHPAGPGCRPVIETDHRTWLAARLLSHGVSCGWVARSSTGRGSTCGRWSAVTGDERVRASPRRLRLAARLGRAH
jgi:hypothetical protein